MRGWYTHGGSQSYGPRLLYWVPRALDLLPDEDSPLRVGLLGAAVMTTGIREPGAAASLLAEAAAMAERCDDERARADVLQAEFTAFLMVGPPAGDWVERARELADRLDAGARRLQDPGLLANALWLQGHVSLAAGDVAGFAGVCDACANPPFGRTLLLGVFESVFRTGLASIRGDDTGVRKHIADAWALGATTDTAPALLGLELGHRYFLGGDDPTGLAALIEGIDLSSFSGDWIAPAIRCAVAALAMLGGDTAAAVALVRDPPADLLKMPGYPALIGVGFMAETIADVGEPGPSAELYEWLAPAAGQYLFPSGLWTLMGSVDHYLGLFAMALGRFDDAERHFASALEMEARIGAEHLVARTHHRWAQLALRRGDDAAATEHVEASLEICGRRGMAYFASRVEALRPSPAARAPLADSPLVGRSAELAQAEARLDRGVIVFAGEPGIGKTRLATEVAHLAAERGAEVHWARCWEGDGAPAFWPWTQLLRSIGAASLEERAASFGSGADRFQLIDAIGQEVVAATRRAPQVLVIDDLQWADASSLEALRHVADLATRAPVLVVVTARPGPALYSLDRDALRIEVGPLDDAAISELVADVDPATADRIRAVCDGNPFFATALARSGGSSDSVRGLVRQQLAALPSESQDALGLAAVIGREFRAGMVGDVDAAVDAGLVRPIDSFGARYEFVHDIVRETIYDDLPRARRVALHKSVLDRIGDGYPAELAHHALAAGDDLPRAAELARSAGDEAWSHLAYDEAAEWYRRAREALDASADPDRRMRAELLLAEGSAKRLLIALDAQDVLHAAAGEARALGDAELLARVAVTWAYRAGGAGVFDERLPSLVQEALVAFTEPGSLRARLLGAAAIATAPDDPVLADGLAVEALEHAEQCDDDDARAAAWRARFTVFQFAAVPGTWIREGNDLADRMDAAALAIGDPNLFSDAQWLRTTIRMYAADVDGVERAVNALEAPPYGQTYVTRVHALLHSLMLAGLRYDLVSFDRHMGAMNTLARETDANVTAVFAIRGLHEAAFGRHDMSHLAPTLEAMIDSGTLYHYVVPAYRCVLAGLHARYGDADVARSMLSDLPADIYVWPFSGAQMAVASVTEAAVELGESDVADAVHAWLAPISGQLLVSVWTVLGSVDYYLGALETLLGRHDEAEQHFSDALALEERVRAPHLQARTHYRWAQLAHARRTRLGC